MSDMTSTHFAGRTVVVTGASRGIGLAIARAFHAEGARVVGTRTAASVADASRDATQDACDAWIASDFTDLAQIDACAEELKTVAPDILINNAGINKNAPFVEIVPEEFLRIHRVNVYAPFRLCQAVIPSMAKRRWGRIVSLSSIWGKISKAHRATYSATKFAIDGLTVGLAAEHAADGILANSVAPGFIDTDLTHRMLGDEGIRQLVAGVPMGRLGTVDEIARLVLWLSSNENTFITGQNIAIDGGFTRV